MGKGTVSVVHLMLLFDTIDENDLDDRLFNLDNFIVINYMNLDSFYSPFISKNFLHLKL